MAELVIPGTKTARVLFECSWAASLSIFQMVFAHSLALFITAVVHVRVFPEIWTQSIYSIDWFKFRYNGFLDQKGCYILDHETDSWSRYVKDIEAGRNSSNDDDTIKAPWARTIRRGIDAPFKSNPPSAVTSPSTTATSFPKTAPCPVAPLRIQSRNIAGSRFIERFRESARLSRPESVSQMQTASRTRMEPFPPHVDDHDLPIPLPRLSKWMSADDIKGLDVHTINPTPTS
ncbi:hypothetical protein H0H87_000104 [Tephrocybe sp. NHM501043]|nr:hypothetical protein H0H87_000104 [Tephrocybe sp. NHM501043]